MKRLRYIGKTLKQDVTDQKTCSKLVTKLGVTKCNNETSSFFFYQPISFVTKHYGFIKKKIVCFNVSFRFTLFRNEHISDCLVCYILFQSFPYIF